MNFEQNVRRLAEERLCELREEGEVTGLTIVHRNGAELLLIGIAAETDVQAPTYDAAAVEKVRKRLSQVLGDLPFRILGEPMVPLTRSSPDGTGESSRFGTVASRPAIDQCCQSELPDVLPDQDVTQQKLVERLSRVERQVAQLPPGNHIALIMATALAASMASFVAATAGLLFPNEIRDFIGKVVRWITPT